MSCEKCQAPQSHVVLKTLPSFPPPEIAMRKRRWEQLIFEYTKMLARQEKAKGQLNAIQTLERQRNTRSKIWDDPQLVHMQKCLGELAIFEQPCMLQTWSCQQEEP